MRKEIENWWKQANYDLETAKENFKIKRFTAVSFYSQQAVEKAIKALILYKTKEKLIEGHSLVYLAQRAKLPKNFYTGLKKLGPHYFISRYPDITEEAPYELYDENLVNEFISIAEQVLKWIEKQLK